MTTYESAIQTLNCNAEFAYAQMTDLRKLETFKDKIPQDKVKEMQFTEDSISFRIDPVGLLTLRIIDKEPFKTVKFGAENSPIQFNLWIQLKELSECDTRMKITIKADIPVMLKPMIGNKIDKGMDQLAQGISTAINKACH